MKFDSYLYETSEPLVAIRFYKGIDHCLVVGLFCPDRSDRRQGTENESLVRRDTDNFFDSWQNQNHLFIREKRKNLRTPVRTTLPLKRLKCARHGY